MSTERWLVCNKCGNKKWQVSLFDALKEITDRKETQCDKCGETMKLNLKFSFAFGASGGDVDVVEAFLPEKIIEWENNGDRIEYYPFLVLLRNSQDKNKEDFWLPYWHLHYVGGEVKKKYGQWAPLMDKPLFESLIAQAKNKGCL